MAVGRRKQTQKDRLKTHFGGMIFSKTKVIARTYPNRAMTFSINIKGRRAGLATDI